MATECVYDENLYCCVHGHFAAQDDICTCLHHSSCHDDDNVCSWEDCRCTDYRSRTSGAGCPACAGVMPVHHMGAPLQAAHKYHATAVLPDWRAKVCYYEWLAPGDVVQGTYTLFGDLDREDRDAWRRVAAYVDRVEDAARKAGQDGVQ